MGTKYLGAKFEVTDDLDVNGATQLDGTLTVGVDDTGHDVKFFGDTSGKYMQWDASANQLRVEGGIRIDSSSGNAIFKCDTGNLKIQVNEADHDLILQSDDGSGSITSYLTLKGNVTKTLASKNIEFQDNVKAEFGAGDDLEIYHDGTDSFINNDTGDLYIKNSTNDKDIIFQSDDGSGGTTTYMRLDGSQKNVDFLVPVDFGASGGGGGHDVTFFGDTNGFDMFWDTTQNALRLDDGVNIYVGSGNDLKINHS